MCPFVTPSVHSFSTPVTTLFSACSGSREIRSLRPASVFKELGIRDQREERAAQGMPRTGVVGPRLWCLIGLGELWKTRLPGEKTVKGIPGRGNSRDKGKEDYE